MSSNGYSTDLQDQIGYKPVFLGETFKLGLPTFSASLQQNVLIKKEPNFDATGSWREYIHYSVATNKTRRQPICVAVNINQNFIQKTTRTVKLRFGNDTKIGEEYQTPDSYFGPIWNRGHMSRRETAVWSSNRDLAKRNEEALAAEKDTYYFSNACLQHRYLNQDEWVKVENWVRDLAEDKNDKITVFSGPIYNDEEKSELPTQFIGFRNKYIAEIPLAFFKVVCFIDENENLATRSFIFPQDHEFGSGDRKKVDTLQDKNGKSKLSDFQVPIADVEGATGLVFPQSVKNADNPIAKVDAVPIVDSNSPSNPAGIMVPDNVFIVEANINPEGNEKPTEEWIKIKNNENGDIDLNGWTIEDNAERKLTISEVTILGPGQVTRLDDLGDVRLTNTGGFLILRNSKDEKVDKVKWGKIGDGKTKKFSQD
eukprot:CAMPEP_0116127468 /NCGR_PEP_ID=MMETSP0329-20121206/6855_1 /TAXON_ID=697910 /ORGANISM="Pseudo-nitzschia arenysensis, Strain B593" /LENGTH=425 /DNA_ID=CAMNT_0003621567 /DNA_START=105 /DNA_END=1382 /DNA_ORIENTATION=+